jgi:hypothetical protein
MKDTNPSTGEGDFTEQHAMALFMKADYGMVQVSCCRRGSRFAGEVND